MAVLFTIIYSGIDRKMVKSFQEEFPSRLGGGGFNSNIGGDLKAGMRIGHVGLHLRSIDLKEKASPANGCVGGFLTRPIHFHIRQISITDFLSQPQPFRKPSGVRTI